MKNLDSCHTLIVWDEFYFCQLASIYRFHKKRACTWQHDCAILIGNTRLGCSQYNFLCPMRQKTSHSALQVKNTSSLAIRMCLSPGEMWWRLFVVCFLVFEHFCHQWWVFNRQLLRYRRLYRHKSRHFVLTAFGKWVTRVNTWMIDATYKPSFPIYFWTVVCLIFRITSENIWKPWDFSSKLKYRVSAFITLCKAMCLWAGNIWD